MLRGARHLVSFLLVLAALLYGGAPVRASEASDDPANAPHVALLLPTGSVTFAKAAEAVRAGFLEAWGKQTSRELAIRLYSVSDDPQDVVTLYRRALASGATLVVGPLTRNGVTALAGETELVKVPTLMLNVPEPSAARSAHLYTLSLHIEAEARQVAQLALAEGRRKALTISDQTLLAKRMRDAFVEAFERGGGHHIADYGYPTDTAGLERLKQAAALGVSDMAFFALDAARARVIRPQIEALPAYGTSQLNPGSLPSLSPVELEQVRFLDMPWMVQPDHPAVMVYAHPAQRENDDFERLYALGIDAFRVGHALLNGKRDLDIDGVTGRLTLDADGHVRRGLLITLISGGRLTVLGESNP